MGRKRRQYRVAPDNLFLSAEVRLSEGRVLQGYVLDVSGGGAGVVVAAGDYEGPEAGTAVELVLDSYKLQSSIRVRGVVRRCVRIEDALRCGIEFEAAGTLEQQVPAHLREQFNRRRFVRAPVPSRIRVQVTDGLGKHSCFGQVLDLSAGGMRVALPLLDARRVDQWQKVWVTFGLPDGQGTVHLGAVVRNRLGVRVGLEFDPARCRDMEKVRARLQAFVERQAPVHEPDEPH